MLKCVKQHTVKILLMISLLIISNHNNPYTLNVALINHNYLNVWPVSITLGTVRLSNLSVPLILRSSCPLSLNPQISVWTTATPGLKMAAARLQSLRTLPRRSAAALWCQVKAGETPVKSAPPRERVCTLLITYTHICRETQDLAQNNV